MVNKSKIIQIFIGILFLIIGLYLFFLWYLSTNMIAPGSWYPDTLPLYIPVTILILIIIAICALLWNYIVKMKNITKIVLVIILVCFLILTSLIINLNFYTKGTSPLSPYIELQPDDDNKTLKVTLIQPGDFENKLFWENVILTEGNATLPTGSIDVGDIITNCSGLVKLRITLGGGTSFYLFNYRFT